MERDCVGAVKPHDVAVHVRAIWGRNARRQSHRGDCHEFASNARANSTKFFRAAAEPSENKLVSRITACRPTPSSEKGHSTPIATPNSFISMTKSPVIYDGSGR